MGFACSTKYLKKADSEEEIRKNPWEHFGLLILPIKRPQFDMKKIMVQPCLGMKKSESAHEKDSDRSNIGIKRLWFD